MDVSNEGPGWLMLVFSLPAKRASERVEVWRKLKRCGALPLGTSGYLLPMTPANHERFEWLAASIRRYKGQASVVQVHSIDELPADELVKRFVEARSREYESLMRDLKKISRSKKPVPQLARMRRRFQEIVAIDSFGSPLRSRVESLLAQASQPREAPAAADLRRQEFQKRSWVTRPRPGIDRVSSAWLIARFIDPEAKFVFASEPGEATDAVPFDMFQAGGFGHRGDDCTFETLRREFAIRDAKVGAIAEIIHDADLEDGKFGRSEGVSLDRVLIGWGQQGVPDAELLRRGIQIIEGLYQSLP